MCKRVEWGIALRKRAALVGLAMMMILNGCGVSANMATNTNKAVKTINSGFVAMAPGIYDSADTAIVICRDEENKSITFQNLETGKQYTLHYDGTTTIRDKYDQEISISQISDGSIVENKFFKSKKALSYLKMSPEAFIYEHLQNYSFLPQSNQMTVGSNTYALNGNMRILSNGKEIDPIDLNKSDAVQVCGIGNTVYSIMIEQGHGYLRLKNEDYFLGGWIEIGQTVIRDVQEDMLLVVPEGSYQVKISKDGNVANQTITFVRDEELVWDLGTVAISQVQKGSLIFTVHPMEAQVTIDGEVVDISEPYETDYGVHQLIATADGYDTITQYIKLSDDYANIDITMMESEEEEAEEKQKTDKNEIEKADTTESTKKNTDVEEKKTEKIENKTDNNNKPSTDNDNTDKKNTEQDTTDTAKDSKKNTSGNYRVYVDSPKGVEVYLDGNYIGVAPLDFKKEYGNYVITLRKSGYQTRSYSISLEDDNQDVNFSFSDLLKLEE